MQIPDIPAPTETGRIAAQSLKVLGVWQGEFRKSFAFDGGGRPRLT